MRNTLTGCTRTALAVSIVGLSLISVARADVYTDRPGSLLIFPKVVRTTDRDTVIQLSSKYSMVNQVRCFYIDGQLDSQRNPVCSEVDFYLSLTRKQPTQWTGSAGRQVRSGDAFGSSGAGFDPGIVPALPLGFTGALVCLEVESSGFPVARNSLMGEATLVAPAGVASANESKYNAIAVPAGAALGLENDLDLNGGVSDPWEYGACPSVSRVNYVQGSANDPIIQAIGNGGLCAGGANAGLGCNSNVDCPLSSCTIGGASGSSVQNRISALPCRLDLENGVPTNVTLNFDSYNEFEERLSGSLGFSCWSSFDVARIPVKAGTFATATITSNPPIVGVVESFHSDSVGNSASRANNLHTEGSGVGTQIRLPD